MAQPRRGSRKRKPATFWRGLGEGLYQFAVMYLGLLLVAVLIFLAVKACQAHS